MHPTRHPRRPQSALNRPQIARNRSLHKTNSLNSLQRLKGYATTPQRDINKRPQIYMARSYNLPIKNAPKKAKRGLKLIGKKGETRPKRHGREAISY